jgi:hypothetical protein
VGLAVHGQGLEQALQAETHVGQERPAIEEHPQQHVRARAHLHDTQPHTRLERVHHEPDLAQRRHEQRVLLEAVAAAPARTILSSRSASSSEIGRPIWMSRFSNGTDRAWARCSASRVTRSGRASPRKPMRAK